MHDKNAEFCPKLLPTYFCFQNYFQLWWWWLRGHSNAPTYVECNSISHNNKLELLFMSISFKRSPFRRFPLALFSCKYQYLITKLGPNKRIRSKLHLQHEKYNYVIDNSFARMHIFQTSFIHATQSMQCWKSLAFWSDFGHMTALGLP